MIVTLGVLIITSCILLAGYYAGTETGFYRLNRVRLRFRLKEGSESAKHLDEMVAKPDEFIITTLVGNNLCVFLATLVCTQLYELGGHYEDASRLATLTLVGPIFIFGEVLQKEVFRRAADTLMYRATKMLKLSMKVLSPVVVLLKQVQRFWGIFMRGPGAGRELQVGRHRLYHFFSESADEGTLSDYQKTMAANIMRLENLRIEKVMIPFGDAASIRLSQTLDEFREIVRKSPYTRFPVSSPHGRLLGIVNVFEVLSHSAGPFQIAQYLREPTELDRETSVIKALNRLKHSGQPMGFVTEDHEKVVGIVTVKDLVEEIVGELGEW